MLRKLERVDNVNDVTDYFSYNHFYVIYYKFLQLSGPSHQLTKNELSNYAEGGKSSQLDI